MADTLFNYVKFLRGTPTAFANLPIKDADTLYFISEEDQKVGQLWIGDKLITDTTNEDSIIDSLSELKDVDLTGVLNNQVLGYDAVNQKWIPMTIDGAIASSIMSGASETEAGKEGLVPAPAAGDQNKFLRGDGTWAEIDVSGDTVEEIKTDITNLENIIGSPADSESGTSASGIYAELDNKANSEDVYTKTQIDEIISGINGLQRKKVNSIDEIDLTAEDADQYIYIIPSGDAENNQYEEYIVIDGILEKIGSIGTSSGEVNVINAVNEEEFEISTDGTRTLSLKTIPAAKISNLEANESFTVLQADIADLKTASANTEERLTTLEDVISTLQTNSSWGEI